MLTILSYPLIFSPWKKVNNAACKKKASVFAWLRCISPLLGHFDAKFRPKKSNRELGVDNCCIRAFDVERDSLMASTSHDGESAYMLGLNWTSVPLRWFNHNKCCSCRNCNCTQIYVRRRQGVKYFLQQLFQQSCEINVATFNFNDNKSCNKYPLFNGVNSATLLNSELEK